MSMKLYGDLMASVGEFTDDQGRKAKRWLKCGVVMKDDKSGKLSVKIDCVPVMQSSTRARAGGTPAGGCWMTGPRGDRAAKRIEEPCPASDWLLEIYFCNIANF